MGMKRFSRWPRFRYSLRTFFVVLTVFGIWLGWQVNIVRERRELLDKLEQAPRQGHDLKYVLGEGDIGDDWDADQSTETRHWNANNRKSTRVSRSGEHPVHVNLIRRLFGDQGVYSIGLPSSLEHDRKKFIRAFPEAEVTLIPTSALSTATLIEFLTGPADDDDYGSAVRRALAIDVLGERKAVEAIPHLIDCLNDFRALMGSDNFVAGHASNALESITNHYSDGGVDQAKWRQWWKGQIEDVSPQWTDIRSETVCAYWRGLELCVGQGSGSKPGWYWVVCVDSAKSRREIARSLDSELSTSESSARRAAEAAARMALEK